MSPGCRCGGGADHEHITVDPSVARSLYQYIDLASLRCLNVLQPANLPKVIRSSPEPFDNDKFIESDADAQIIVSVSFSGVVKLKSISIQGVPDESTPAELKVFCNNPDIDFTNVERSTPAQTWQLVHSSSFQPGAIEYPTRATKFTNVSQLTLFFPKNHGSKRTRISFIGFQGEFSYNRTGPVIAAYELRPNIAEHKLGEEIKPQIGPSF